MVKEGLAEVWLERLESRAREGLTVAQWCARHGVPQHQFYYWRHKLTAPSGDKSQGAGWCALDIVSEASPTQSGSSGVAIRMGQASIEVAAGFDAAVLRAVVRALEVQPC
jgi:transposase-like protein